MYFTVPLPGVTTSPDPSGLIERSMVGSPLVITCTVKTVDGVEPNSVMINWIGPEGSYTNHSRIIIHMDGTEDNPLYLNTYNSTLQFAYLKEGDEGIYRCSVTILDTVNSQIAEIKSLTSKQQNFIILYRLAKLAAKILACI